MKKHKKIGLVSTQFTINYGAILQAYALQSSLKLLGYDVVTIDYRPQDPKYGRIEKYGYSSVKEILLTIIKIANINYRISTHKKRALFDEFLQDFFSLSEKTYKSIEQLRAEVFEIDALVCGSDQIWNLNLIDDKAFFLDFGGGEVKRISYAASLGEKLSASQLNKIAERTAKFDKISLRESANIEELRLVTDKEIVTLVDPVFLLAQKDWIRLIANTEREETPYILVYEVASNENFGLFLKAVVNHFGIRVICISTRAYRKYRNSENLLEVSPIRFVSLINDADFIVTSSFHAVAFSTILNKKFVCCPSFDRSGRHKELLDNLGLGHRILSDISTVDNILSIEEDWDSINKKIDNMSTKGLAFLNEI